ncbi:CG0192-related protein [Microbacterium sp. M1A1_1b]
MAVIHNAELRPSKTEAMGSWLPSQAWSGVEAGSDVLVDGRFRFDDPDGQVGVETYLVHVDGGPVLHVPLTYRGAPLAGAEDFLVCEMEHSVLGRRWVYDAAGDPVYADVLRRAIATSGHEARLESAEGGEAPPVLGTAVGRGSAATSPTVHAVTPRTDGALTTIGDLTILRVVGTALPAGETLTATWNGSAPTVLAVLRP